MELPKASRRNTTVGAYVLGEEIGKGANGQVYKAIDTTDGSMVAIKEIALRRLDDRSRRALRLEIDLLTELGAHENVVELRGVVEHDEYVYVVLELAENGSLASLVKPTKFGPCSERLARVYVRQILEGLAHAHARGVVHRDVKGANVLTTKDGVVKLADFGVALRVRSENEDGTESNESIELDVQGTPYWMAPEAIEMRDRDGKPASFASDVWSVGCVTLELITGAPPYFDMQPMPAMFAIVNNKRPPLPERVSPELRDFLKQCFRKDPTRRPSARGALAHAWLAGKNDARRSEKKTGLPAPAPPPSEERTRDGDDSTGTSPTSDDSEAEPEWSAPLELGAASRRRRKIPPSSPFQDAPVLDGGDGATPTCEPTGSVAVAATTDAAFSGTTTNATKSRDAGTPSDDGNGDPSLLERRTLELTLETRDARPGAARRLATLLKKIEAASTTTNGNGWLFFEIRNDGEPDERRRVGQRVAVLSRGVRLGAGARRRRGRRGGASGGPFSHGTLPGGGSGGRAGRRRRGGLRHESRVTRRFGASARDDRQRPGT